MTQRDILAGLIEGRTDAEILEGAHRHGIDTILSRIFEGMRDHFVPERAVGQTAVIQYDIGGADGTATWQLNVDAGACSVTQGNGGPAGVVIAMALPDFLRLLSGQTDGPTLFMSGKLTMSGDFMLAQTMQTWFDRGA